MHVLRMILVLLVLGLTSSALVGCQSSNCNDCGGTTDAQTRFRITLREFNSDVVNGYERCSDLAADIEQAGRLVANLIIEENVREATFFDSGSVSGSTGATADDSDGDAASGTSAGGDEQGRDDFDPEGYATNTQVQGVDEADIVKSDGQYIYLAYGDELIVQDLAGTVLDRVVIPKPSEEALAAVPGDEVDLSFLPPPRETISGLLFHDGKIAVLVAGWGFVEDAVIRDYTRVLLYEVSSAGELGLIEETLVTGLYQAARERDGKAHVVTLAIVDHSELTSGLYRFQARYAGMNDAEYQTAAFRAAEEAISGWRDSVLRTLLATPDGDIPEDACDHIVQVSTMRQGSSSDSEEDPDLTDGAGVLNGFAQILSFDIDEGLSARTVAGAFVPTYGLITYANEDTVVLGGSGWHQFGVDIWENTTFLMAFTTETGRAEPLAVGSVPGTILNQFSMDVHDDHLRVASTVEQRWEMRGSGVWQPVSVSESVVTVLRLGPKQMETVGEVRGLGLGERLFSARFIEDRAFLVTFLQIDPFYALDLSDPAAPRVVGELEIPGFSNYLHPVGEDTLLAVGQDVDPVSGELQGLQVALFDVADLANPLQLHKHVVEGWSASGAEQDHRAFRYLPGRNTLILPLSSYSARDGSSFDGFQLYDVSVANGIVVLGRVTHADQAAMDIGCYSPAYLPPRSLVFGDQLVTLKGHSVGSHDMLTLESQWEHDLDPGGGGGGPCYPWFLGVDGPVPVEAQAAGGDAGQ